MQIFLPIKDIRYSASVNDGSKTLEVTNLAKHKLVEWVIPLHQQYAGRRLCTKVCVILRVMRIGHNAATITTLGVGHLSRRCKSPENFNHIFQNKRINGKISLNEMTIHSVS